MSIRNYLARTSSIVCLAVGFSAFAAAKAEAANLLYYPAWDLRTGPYTISFGAGPYFAGFTLTDISSTSSDPFTVDAVSTDGDGMVNSFFGPVSFTAGSVIGDTGYDFAAFPTAAGIPYSAAETSIGLRFSLVDGVHYGFVTTLGTEVIKYGYNDTAGGFITVGVPETSAWIMMVIGFAVLGAPATLKAIRTRPAQT